MPTVIEWVKKLEAQIEAQKLYAKPYEQRYANEYVLPFIAQEYREVYGARADTLLVSLLEAPRSGAAAIGIDALVERLTVLGGTSDDPATNAAVKAIWEDNDLDVMHHEAIRDTLVRSVSYGAASRAVDGRRSVVTIESSEQATVHRMKAPPYDVDAYFKISVDEWTGKRTALFQIVDFDIHLIEDDTPAQDPDPAGTGTMSRWRIARTEPRPGAVPVVEFPHTPRLIVPPKSEIEPITTLVDLVDLIEGLMVFAGHFGAVPIRFVSGLDVPRDPKDPTKPLLGPDGKPLIGFNPRADHVWIGGPGTEFGQLTPANLTTFTQWAAHARANLRTKTKVASTYYALDLKSHMSAELLKTDEAPMVRRLRLMGPQGVLNQSYRRLLSHAAAIEGHFGRIRPLWEDPQTRMDAQAVDAFQKAVASGIGVVTAAEQFLGWPRDRAEQAAQEFLEQAERAAQAASDPFALLDPATRAALKGAGGNPVPATGA